MVKQRKITLPIYREGKAQRRQSWVRVCLALCLSGTFAFVFFSGCTGDRGPERVVVSGKVTYNGKSIPTGEIRFMPVLTSPGVPVSGSFIVDGNYKAGSHGGVAVGAYKVQIEAYRRLPPTPGQRPLEDFEAPREQYLPQKFNTQTQLEMTIEPGSGEIVKDFDLKD